MAQQHTAVVHKLQGQLTADCTHLVAEGAQPTDKFLTCCSDAPALRHVRVVSCAWLAACMRRGVRARAWAVTPHVGRAVQTDRSYERHGETGRNSQTLRLKQLTSDRQS